MKVENLTLGLIYNGLNDKSVANVVGVAAKNKEHVKVYNAFGDLVCEVESAN